MTIRNLLLTLLFALTCCSKPASAALITSDIFHVGGDIWEYHYSIENNTAFTIEQFALYFPADTYQDLVDISTLPDWDILLFQPGAFFPQDDGIFDALALIQGINPGQTLSGFAVRFTYIGNADLGGQLFEVFDPFDFSAGPIDSGQTPQIALPNRVAEPAIWWLMLFGLATVCLFARQSSRRTL